jgi:hypothetical protein
MGLRLAVLPDGVWGWERPDGSGRLLGWYTIVGGVVDVAGARFSIMAPKVVVVAAACFSRSTSMVKGGR